MRDFMKISQSVFNLESGHVYGINGYVQSSKGISSKHWITRVMFMSSARCLMMLYIYVKLRENIRNGMLWSRHENMIEMAMFNAQRAITPKLGRPELWFMCSVHSLMILYIAVKFRDNISNDIRVMERTWNYKGLTDGHSKFRTV